MSPHRGLKLPMTGDTRQGIEADGQHKTRNLKNVSDDLGCPAFFITQILMTGNPMSKKIDKETIAEAVIRKISVRWHTM